jgi:hypothetical protein
LKCVYYSIPVNGCANYCRNHNPNIEQCHGLALHKCFLAAQQYEDNLSGRIWRNIANPCANCEVLIDLYGGNNQNFLRTNGQAGAPP